MLNVSNLSVQFYHPEQKQWTEVVHSINFELNEGRVLGIVGESGSGKSVSSFALMQLNPAKTTKQNGKIVFNEVNLLSLSSEDIRKYRGKQIAMIFQEPMTSLNPVLSCGAQVTEAIMLHQRVGKNVAKQQTIELFKEVMLPRPNEIFDSYPHQISGGQKQRVMIAMALSCKPKLLIADEPTTALDVTVQKSIIDLLKKINKNRQMAMLFISHDLGLIAEIADDLIVMKKGDIVEKGVAKEVFENPKHPYTKGLLACRPSPKLNLKKLPTVADFIESGKDIADFYTPENSISESERNERRAGLYSQMPILEIKNVSTCFQSTKGLLGTKKYILKAVDDVSFEVFPGETLGLVGESGCGKSTLGRTILQLIKASEGEIKFKGKSIQNLPARQMRELRKDIQLIFQDPYSSLNPKLTIGQAIMEVLVVHNILSSPNERKSYIIQLLEKVKLDASHYDRYPHEFSGGQRQRIVIARALALKPALMVCDESVSALDVSVQAQVLNLLRDLQAEFGLTYIFISHDLSVVKHLSDRVLVMNKGKIEEIGYPEDIYENPQKEYTRKLILASPH
jgi:peptide/nickel transport system ATP-binding protein